MPIPAKILNFLKKSKVNFEILNHKKVYTAFDKAATLKIPLKNIGKTLVLKIGKKLGLLLIEGDKKADFKKIQKKLKTKIELASEKLITRQLKGVKLGAIPPLGFLWKIPTLGDRKILRKKAVILSALDWKSSIKISGKEIKKLIPDLIWGDFSKK